MSQELHSTKNRIASVKSTKKITQAMKLVATAKLSVWKDRLIESSLYNKTLVEIVQYVASKMENITCPFMEKNEVVGKLYIIVTSNLGLCAGYNYNLFRMIDKQLTPNDTIIIIGSKGLSHYKNKGFNIIDDFVSNASNMNYASILKMGEMILRDYELKKYSSVEFVYTKYVNSLVFIPEKMQLLPVDSSFLEQEERKGFGIIMEPNAQEIIDTLIPQYVKSVLYAKMLESQVAEQASRRTAMENATNNATDLEEELLIKYHKARQSAITEEITEIVSGANKN